MNVIRQRFLQCMQIKSQGVAGLYTGIWANFLLCLNPAIKHAVFDQVRQGVRFGSLFLPRWRSRGPYGSRARALHARTRAGQGADSAAHKRQDATHRGPGHHVPSCSPCRSLSGQDLSWHSVVDAFAMLWGHDVFQVLCTTDVWKAWCARLGFPCLSTP